ncbi:MAG TPA: oligopeptide transporter, OPT family [Candidatus Binataceae bacterium]|nr:oligopeptide transporter, OPT family [Candidatus Binataceae bacterium]
MPEASPERVTVAGDAEVREFTARGFVIGAILALLLGSANAYLGLYAGMTVSASIPAAVISMAVLRVLGGATILENNVVQTIASAGEAVAAGAIFTFPALVILGYRGPLPYWDVTALCLAGGTIGSLLVVFLRRAYIVEERLPFPEGLACAEVLRAGAAGSAGVAPLAFGGVIAAALKAAQDVLGIVPGAISGARWIGKAAFAGSIDISAALLGVGHIVGVQIASLVFLGGAIAWLLAVPIASALHPQFGSFGAAAAAQQIWSGEARYLGVGAMLTGGIAVLWRLRRAIGRGLVESSQVLRVAGSATPVARVDTDLPTGVVLAAVILSIPVIFVVSWLLSGSLWLSAAMALALAVIGFFATAIAGYLTGIVGASNNPVSGVTIIVLLAIAILLKLLGVTANVGPRLAIMAGAVVCTAAAMAGDSMHDLATGFHVGATPRRLEVAVLLGAIVSSFLMAPILNLLIRGYGIAGMPGAKAQALAAPQAFLMAKVAQGVFSGDLPWRIIVIGAILAVGLIWIDGWLVRRKSRWRTPVMPVAIGLYLPLGLSVAILLGSLARIRRPSQSEGASFGLLFAAGLVAGEALMGVASGVLVTAGTRLPLF